jgi:hypothetical protein
MPLTNKLWKLQDKKPKYSTGNVLNTVVDSDLYRGTFRIWNGKSIRHGYFDYDDYFN